MGVVFNRHLGGEDTLLCGQFTLETESFRAAIKCALCGLVYSLPKHCRVEPDGRVVPAVRCPQISCPFFEFITLSDHWMERHEL